MDLRLGIQVVFVAGFSRGIGKAIAATLLDEGARVVLTGRDEGSLRAAQLEFTTPANRERILAIQGNFADASTIAGAFERTVQHFGRIDHLIANLGTGSGKPGWDQPDEEWQRLFELNFFASMRLTQAALPHLLSNLNGGSILYISSIVAVEATAAPLPYSPQRLRL